MSTVPSTRLLSWLLVAVVLLPLALFIQAGLATYNATRDANDRAIEQSVDVLGEYVLRLMETVQAAMREGEGLVRGLGDADILARDDDVRRSFVQIAAGLPHVERVQDR